MLAFDFLQLLLIVAALVKFHHELNQIAKYKKDYIKNPWNCIEVSLFFLRNYTILPYLNYVYHLSFAIYHQSSLIYFISYTDLCNRMVKSKENALKGSLSSTFCYLKVYLFE